MSVSVTGLYKRGSDGDLSISYENGFASNFSNMYRNVEMSTLYRNLDQMTLQIGNNVANCNNMFSNARNLPKKIIVGKNVVNMCGMFRNATASASSEPVEFKQNFNDGRNYNFGYMFANCISDKIYENFRGITSGISPYCGIQEVFSNSNFNDYTVTFPDGKTSLAHAFYYANMYNRPITIPNSVINLSYFLTSAKSFNQPLHIPENVNAIEGMLSYADKFNPDNLTFENSYNIRYANKLFENSNISSINSLFLPNVVYAPNMFSNCKKLISANNIRVAGGVYRSMFDACDNLTSVSNLSSTPYTYTNLYCDNMFRNCYKLTSVSAPEFMNTINASNVTTARNVNFMQMFAGCNNLQTVSLGLPSIWNFVDTADYSYSFQNMFAKCNRLRSFGVTNWKLEISHSKNDMLDTGLYGTFDNCNSLQPMNIIINAVTGSMCLVYYWNTYNMYFTSVDVTQNYVNTKTTNAQEFIMFGGLTGRLNAGTIKFNVVSNFNYFSLAHSDGDAILSSLIVNQIYINVFNTDSTLRDFTLGRDANNLSINRIYINTYAKNWSGSNGLHFFSNYLGSNCHYNRIYLNIMTNIISNYNLNFMANTSWTNNYIDWINVNYSWHKSTTNYNGLLGKYPANNRIAKRLFYNKLSHANFAINGVTIYGVSTSLTYTNVTNGYYNSLYNIYINYNVS